MTILLLALGVAFAAFGVWLTVRIVNRRERRPKRTALALAMLLVGYPLSFGPACWISDRDLLPEDVVNSIYSPIVTLCISTGGTGFRRAMMWYGELLPTPQPQAGPRRWSTVEDIFYAAIIRWSERAESK